MRIVFASHTPIGSRFVVGSHHLARVLAHDGHDVLHLASPVTPFHAPLRLKRGSRQRLLGSLRESDPPNLTQIAPFALIPGRLYMRMQVSKNLTLASIVPSLRRQLDGAGFGEVDIAFIDKPLYSGLWEYTHCRRIVYRPTDVYPLMRGLAGLTELERRLLDHADGVVSTSVPVKNHIEGLSERRLPHMVLENGVDYEHFSQRVDPPWEYRDIPSPRAVYVGSLDGRFDWAAVTSAALRLPDIQFVLIGPLTEGSRAGLPVNVHTLGARPYESVPAYLQHAAAGLLPLSEHPANAGRSPMKLYEYMAAGLPVVARATAELTRRRHACVSLYGSTDDFVGKVRTAVEQPCSADSARAGARSFTWERRARELLTFVDCL